jgi:hypothetical protein
MKGLHPRYQRETGFSKRPEYLDKTHHHDILLLVFHETERDQGGRRQLPFQKFKEEL